MHWEDLLGKRVLVRLKHAYGFTAGQAEEMKVLEVSPSGNFVKLQNGNGMKFWRPIVEVSLVEVLNILV